MRLCHPSPRHTSFVAFRSSLRQLSASAAVALTTLVSGCGGHSSTPVNTAGYNFTNFDYTNATGGTIPTAINNSGVIVGYTAAANKPYTSFLRYTNGSFFDFTFLDAGANVSSQANANGFNDSNFVVGAIIGLTSAGVSVSSAFEAANPVSSTGISVLPLVTPTTTTQTAFGVNNSNVIVGQYFDSATGSTPGFVYANSVYTTIDPAAAESLPSGITFAQGVNNNGIVIGSFAVNGSSLQQGFAYSMTTGQYTYLPNPSTSRITSTTPLASVRFMTINDNNEAAGYYQVSNGSQYAFVFNVTTQTYTFLDDPSAAEAAGFNDVQSTRITGINNSATICGTYTDGNYQSHAFIASLH